MEAMSTISKIIHNKTVTQALLTGNMEIPNGLT